MRNRKSALLLLLIVICLIIIWYTFKDQSIKYGRYTLGQEGSSEYYSYIELREDGTFSYSRDIATSYRPFGNFEVNGDKVILKAQEGLITCRFIDRNKSVLQIVDDDVTDINNGRLFKYIGAVFEEGY